ncbi:DUF5518 domain-containing protein [Natronoarchaeum rubrum]|uniref:DUF5518 domain-containing protein n=1 Tax=Natronoarchaeum rubrum TaxID=755311 RepID=UPI002112EBE6|nr:DUF5518 domain-containing protein [Natronoarchaeum rubrum]
MEPTTSTDSRDSPRVEGSGTLNAVFDAIVSLLIAAAGLGMAAAGIAVYGTGDTATAEEIVADLEVTSTIMTEAELVDAIHSFMVWGGIGLAVTGAALVVVGIGFLVYSRRLRGRREGTGLVIDDRYVLAVVGAVVSAVASFVPFSPVVGGGVAGYVQRSGNGLRVGALAGLALAAPYALLLVFLAGGAFAVNAVEIGLLIVAMLVASAVITVVLSAIGGYAGAVIADR